MLSGNGADPSGRRRVSRSARFAVLSQEMVVSRQEKASTIGGLPVKYVIYSRCVRSSQACLRREAWAECPQCPPIVDKLPPDPPIIGGRGTWAGVGGTVTAGSVFSGTPVWIRSLVGVSGDTASGLVADVEMSTIEYR